MDYNSLHWETLDYVKSNLYRRLSVPLTQAVEILGQLQHADDKQLGLEKLKQVHKNMTALLNTVNAWATLITYKHGGPLSDFQFRAFTCDDVPEWVCSYLSEHTSVRIDFKQTIEVHIDTFIESLLLLFHVARTTSRIDGIQMIDAPKGSEGVYVRVIFSAVKDKAPFLSLGDIESRLDQDDMMERDLAIQLAAACDMMRLNRARFSLQNNKTTFQQSFCAYFETRPEMPTQAAEAAKKYGKSDDDDKEGSTDIEKPAITKLRSPLSSTVIRQTQKRFQITDPEPTTIEKTRPDAASVAEGKPEDGEPEAESRKTPENSRTPFGW